MPSKSAYLIAGASGSHPFETPAEYVTSDGGIVLTSEYPAGYKFYVINAYNAVSYTHLTLPTNSRV